MNCGRSFSREAVRNPGADGWWISFGLSWQIIPTAFAEMMRDKDGAKTQRVMKALMQMKKLDIGKMKQAYEQG